MFVNLPGKSLGKVKLLYFNLSVNPIETKDVRWKKTR